MARLTLRRVGEKAEKKEHVVDAGGAVLGRDLQDADIVIPDKSVSKRHARIFLHKGTWKLEDLGSSNGTHLGDDRITSPVSLPPNARFSVGVFTYEVTSMDPSGEADGGGGEEESLADPSGETKESLALTSAPAKERSATEKKAAPPGKSPRKDSAPPPTSTAKEDEDEDGPAPTAVASRKRGSGSKLPAEEAGKAAAGAGVEEAPPAEMLGDPKSMKFYLAALPRGIAYHLANVPLLVLNPMGTVRKSVEKMPLPELAWPALIVYALPANLFSAAVTFVCTLIMQLISGTLSIGSIIPVVPLVVAVAASVVGGLVCHPVLTWVVGKLQGQSTARQRTNYFVLSMSAVAVTAIPSGLAIMLAAVRLPFIGVLPILLSLVGTALVGLVSYRWFSAFNVVKWFRMAILGVGALVALLSAKSLVETVIAGVKSLGSSSSSSSPGSLSVENVDKGAIAEEAHKEAAEAAEKGAKEVEKAHEKEAEKVEKAAEKEAAKEVEDETPRKGKKGKKGKAGKAEKEDTAEKEPPADKGSPSGGVDYSTYLEHRDAMEKALEQNPRLLKTVPGLLSLYEKYHRAVYEIRNHMDGGGKKKKAATGDPALEPVRQRLKDIEVYEKTQDLVEELLHKVK